MTKLVPGICTQCGSTLEVNPEQDAAICQYCGTPFIVDKAIEKYTIQSVESMNISNSIIQMGPTADNLAKRAKQFEDIGDYSRAEEYYNKALDIDVDNHPSQEGLARVVKLKYEAETQELIENGKYNESQGFLKAARDCYVEARSRDPYNTKIKEHLDALEEKIKTKCKIVITDSRTIYRNTIKKGNLLFDLDRLLFDFDSRLISEQIWIPCSQIRKVRPSFYNGFPQFKNSKRCNAIIVEYTDHQKNRGVCFYSSDATRLSEAINNILAGNY